MPLAQPSQCLNHGAAGTTGRRHLARRGVLDHDVLLAQLHAAGASIGQEDDPNRYLRGQPEHIGGVCPGRLEARLIAALQGRRDVIDRRREQTQTRISPGTIVQATSDLADGAGARMSAQRQINRVPGAKIEEVGRREDMASPPMLDALQKLRVARVRMFAHCLTIERYMSFYVKILSTPGHVGSCSTLVPRRRESATLRSKCGSPNAR